MIPESDALKSQLQTYLDDNYLNVNYFEFNLAQIEALAGIQIQIGATVTNFLGINGTNTTMWTTFSSKKSMYLIDL